MIVVFGHGGHAQAVVNLAATMGKTATMVDYQQIRTKPGRAESLVGIGCSDMYLRERLFGEIMAHHWPDTLCYAQGVERMLEPARAGTVIFPSTIGDAQIGRNVVIYSGCVVEHGATVGDHAWLSPGVILCGNVTVKPRAFLGAGAIVLPGVTIGEGARIGAGAVIHHDVPDGLTVYGPRDEGRPTC